MNSFARRLIKAALSAALLVTVGLGAASIAGAETPDGETPDGETLFNQRTCFTCHGKDGKTPILPFYPLIAGQNAEYVLQQMKDIKSGARANGNTASMRGVMHLVNEEEMKILAEYISTLPR
jgi:cytochrome c